MFCFWVSEVVRVVWGFFCYGRVWGVYIRVSFLGGFVFFLVVLKLGLLENILGVVRKKRGVREMNK